MSIRKINRALKKLEEFQLSLLFTELAQRLDRASNILDNLERGLAQSYEIKNAEVKVEPDSKSIKEIHIIEPVSDDEQHEDLLVYNLNLQNNPIREEKFESFDLINEENEQEVGKRLS